MYIRSFLSCCKSIIHEIYSKVDPQQPEPETIFIELTLHKNLSFKVTVGCVYRPPDSNRAFWSQLEYLTEPFIGHHLMLMGDFNVDFLNPMDTNYSHLQSMCIVHRLSNCVQSPTRFSPTSSRCIDLILGNFPELSQATVDHVPRWSLHVWAQPGASTFDSLRSRRNRDRAAFEFAALPWHSNAFPSNKKEIDSFVLLSSFRQCLVCGNRSRDRWVMAREVLMIPGGY